jgi:hypothetical protein
LTLGFSFSPIFSIQSAIQTMISMEIRSDIEYEKIGIEPAFNIEMLKALYRKLAGFEWKED